MIDLFNDLRRQSTAVNNARSLILRHARKIGMREGEVKSLDRDLTDAADTIALLMGSKDAAAILAVRPS